VLLSMQLAFAVIPLLHFVSDKKRMGNFSIKPATQIAGWVIATIIVILNLKLVYEAANDWVAATDSSMAHVLIYAGGLGLIALLVITIIYPFVLKRREGASINIHKDISMEGLHSTVSVPFKRIALALDYSDKDSKVIQYAFQLGGPDTAYVLMHVVESAQARMMEEQAQDYETIKDKELLHKYVSIFTDKGVKAEGILGFKHRTKEIARIIKEHDCDLLIVGSHGHKSIGDLVFGETINSVRHMINVPVFIAK
jgi:manganese transport protein